MSWRQYVIIPGEQSEPTTTHTAQGYQEEIAGLQDQRVGLQTNLERLVKHARVLEQLYAVSEGDRLENQHWFKHLVKEMPSAKQAPVQENWNGHLTPQEKRGWHRFVIIPGRENE